MGARGPRHGKQLRKNTTARKNQGRRAVARDTLRHREDEEAYEFIDEVLRNTTHGFLHRKYDNGQG